jgi:hypothetical protein
MGPSSSLTFQGVALKGVGSAPVRGRALKWDRPISFLGDVDPATGEINRDGASGNLRDRVLVFPEGAGSTVGSYVIYNMKLNGTAPKAMLMKRAEAIIAMGCIIADIPLVHRIPEERFQAIATGDTVEVRPSDGTITVWKGVEAGR